MRRAATVVLSSGEREILERLSKGRRVSVRLAKHSTVILHAAEGFDNGEIASTLGMTRQKAGRWRDRYVRLGLAGIEKDAAGSGLQMSISTRKCNGILREAHAKHRRTQRMRAVHRWLLLSA